MHPDHRVTPVEDHIPGHVEIMVGNPLGPGREVGRGADRQIDPDFFQLRLEVFRRRFDRLPAEIDGQLKAHAVAAPFIAGVVENFIGLVDVQVIGRHARIVKRAVRMDAGQGRL